MEIVGSQISILKKLPSNFHYGHMNTKFIPTTLWLNIIMFRKYAISKWIDQRISQTITMGAHPNVYIIWVQFSRSTCKNANNTKLSICTKLDGYKQRWNGDHDNTTVTVYCTILPVIYHNGNFSLPLWHHPLSEEVYFSINHTMKYIYGLH